MSNETIRINPALERPQFGRSRTLMLLVVLGIVGLALAVML